jgi:hypothetical protein
MLAQNTPPTGTRAHRRFPASELPGLRTARVKYGPEVSVINLSAGGVLFETEGELRPDSTIVLEFAGATRTFLVPSRVVRCRSLESGGDRVRSSGACAFRRPLPLDDLVVGTAARTAAVTQHTSQQPAIDAGWQAVVGKYRDGRLVRGFTNDFSAKRPYLHISPAPGSHQAQFVSLAHLEALFFMRDTATTGGSQDTGGPTEPAIVHGRKVALSLPNGEEMIGATLNYKINGNGFFVTPLDGAHGTARVFITQTGARSVRFL